MQEKIENNFLTGISERLKVLRLTHQLTQEEFAESIGIKRSNYYQIEAGNQKPTLEIILQISRKYSVSIDYILEGSESKLENQPGLKVVSEPFKKYSGKSEKHIPNQQVPIYNISATAGMVSLFTNHHKYQPVDQLQIPNLPRCDGAMYIKGDSMYPLLKSGDLVIYKQVAIERDSILWGEMYLLGILMEDDEYIAVKYVQKSDRGPEYVCLVSQNDHHQSRDVLLEHIKAMGLVKASIRFNM